MKTLQHIGILLLALTASAAFAAGAPAADTSGLKLIKRTDSRLVYALPGVDLTKFDKVILVDAYVAFQKNWLRDRTEDDPFFLNQTEIAKIKQKVSDEFHKAFVAELEKKGIPVVGDSGVGPGVLIVRPAIINLEITDPDPMGQINQEATVAASAGQMTLYAELYDSASNQLLAKVVDAEADKGFGGTNMIMSTGTNKLAEDRIVDGWASALATHLGHTLNGDD
jgi:hypothetical protein